LGATDHVSSSLTHFSFFKAITPILVKLYTGQHVYATHSGTISFSPSFQLTNVLYIPTFTFNLISISKLVSSLHCELIFSPSSCIIQDMNSKQQIGTVDVNAGLYTLTFPIKATSSVAATIVHPQCTKIPIDL